LVKFVTYNAPNAWCGQPLLEYCDFNSFLILLNLGKDLSPEQLVTIKAKIRVRVVA